MQTLFVTDTEFFYVQNVYTLSACLIGILAIGSLGFKFRKNHTHPLYAISLLIVSFGSLFTGIALDERYNTEHDLPRCSITLSGPDTMEQFTYKKDLVNSKCIQKGEQLIKMDTDQGPVYFRKYEFNRK